MTAAEMRDLFDQLQDKSNNPWFDVTEKDRFLTIAQWKIINQAIKELEEDNDATDRIRTLIKTDAQLTNASSVLLTGGSGVFDDASAAAADPVAILNFSKSDIEFKPVRWNDIKKFEDNTYKASSATAGSERYYYTVSSTGYTLYPAQNAQSIDIVYIMEPTAIDDLPERMHRKQVAMAMAETGYVTEDQALIMVGEKGEVE